MQFMPKSSSKEAQIEEQEERFSEAFSQ